MTVKVISFRELQRLTVNALHEWDDVIISVDGVETWKLTRIDSQAGEASTLTVKARKADKMTELPLSKHKQASSEW